MVQHIGDVIALSSESAVENVFEVHIEDTIDRAATVHVNVGEVIVVRKLLFHRRVNIHINVDSRRVDVFVDIFARIEVCISVEIGIDV
ncbi:hypothetical protein MUU54_14280 [Rhizobium tarimense]|nr:hypothetical protein [Pseudorhizobium tarimense]